MGKGPGLFADIGRMTRDLLYKDYNFDHKISLTTSTSTGVEFSSTGIRKGEYFLGDLKARLKNNRITTDLKVDTGSNILTTVTYDELAPGLKTIFSFTVPDQSSGKLELQYLHDHTGIRSSIGLTASPVAHLSGVFGNDTVAVGGEIEFDTASGGFLKCDGGLSYSKPDFVSSLLVANKGDIIKASYFHTLSDSTITAVGAEIQHSRSRNENTLTIGTQHALDPLTTVKARLDNYGKAAALIQHEWRPKSFITISGEVDSKALHNSAKVGLAVALKP
eukprot:TRINITY_DN77_c0_g1_i1.p1 TRINITY_DN77_c0_g1~~TRINITY_DN77_c0_g1_i1.p1  ORF type:complete len:277 (+),score=61.83 TRINITY_DN77_c0_g1_i1:189-1019(+)